MVFGEWVLLVVLYEMDLQGKIWRPESSRDGFPHPPLWSSRIFLIWRLWYFCVQVWSYLYIQIGFCGILMHRTPGLFYFWYVEVIYISIGDTGIHAESNTEFPVIIMLVLSDISGAYCRVYYYVNYFIYEVILHGRFLGWNSFGSWCQRVVVNIYVISFSDRWYYIGKILKWNYTSLKCFGTISNNTPAEFSIPYIALLIYWAVISVGKNNICASNLVLLSFRQIKEFPQPLTVDLSWDKLIFTMIGTWGYSEWFYYRTVYEGYGTTPLPLRCNSRCHICMYCHAFRILVMLKLCCL